MEGEAKVEDQTKMEITKGSENEEKSVQMESVEKSQVELDGEAIKKKATLLFLQGKRSVYIRDYQAALAALSESCKLFNEIYPEQDDALADPYFYYGKALLEVGRNESDVLGDQVQDEEDDDNEDEDENDENDEEDKVEDQEKESEGKDETEKNGKSSSTENGTSSEGKESEKPGEDEKKENAEEENGEVNDLQLSWEYLELAKLIYSKKADTCKESAIKLAETYLCLGENGLESENYSIAIEDIKQALDLQQKHLREEDRRIAETYYQLGIAHSLGQNYDEAIESFKKAIEQLQTKMYSLEMRKKAGDKKTEEEERDAFYTMDGEINEIKTIIKEIEEKIKDMAESKNKVKAELIKQVCGGGQPSSSHSDGNGAGQSTAPATDISHLVKRKRKNEDDGAAEEKKIKTEDMDSSRSSSVVRKRQTSGDTYCGADRGMFRWCQTISDLDVIILLSSTIKSASDIKVDVTAESIHVQIKISKNQWYTLMEDTFNDKVKSNDVVWTFEPGKLSIHLEKARDKWWDSFLSKEPKINLQEIELTRPVSDLTQEEEMTLQKLWNDQLTKICQVEKLEGTLKTPVMGETGPPSP